MNKQTEKKIGVTFLHKHKKSTEGHSVEPQKDGVDWWIRRCGIIGP